MSARAMFKRWSAQQTKWRSLNLIFWEDMIDVIMSQQDKMFLSMLKEGIRQKEDGHYEMPLPFQGKRPAQPNKKACAEHRLCCLRKCIRKYVQD